MVSCTGASFCISICAVQTQRKKKFWRKKRSRHFPARVSAILLPELWSLSRSPPGSSSPDNHDYVHWITTIMYNRIFRIRNNMRKSYVWILIRGSWRLVVSHPRSIAKLLNGRILHNIFSPFPVLVDTFLSLFFPVDIFYLSCSYWYIFLRRTSYCWFSFVSRSWSDIFGQFVLILFLLIKATFFYIFLKTCGCSSSHITQEATFFGCNRNSCFLLFLDLLLFNLNRPVGGCRACQSRSLRPWSGFSAGLTHGRRWPPGQV